MREVWPSCFVAVFKITSAGFLLFGIRVDMRRLKVRFYSFNGYIPGIHGAAIPVVVSDRFHETPKPSLGKNNIDV